jgi:hypothetical protein
MRKIFTFLGTIIISAGLLGQCGLPGNEMLAALPLETLEPAFKIIPIARPNPYDRGNCFQWKGCKGESIGSMPVELPEFCGPLGGKSWKDTAGKCRDLPEGPRATEPLPPAK